MRSRIHLVAIAVSVAALAGGASAVALGTDSSASVYQACLQHDVGVLYHVKLNPSTPLRCRRGDKLISWAQTGPAGAAGTRGAKGDGLPEPAVRRDQLARGDQRAIPARPDPRAPRVTPVPRVQATSTTTR
jgi:hypothetical protein